MSVLYSNVMRFLSANAVECVQGEVDCDDWCELLQGCFQQQVFVDAGHVSIGPTTQVLLSVYACDGMLIHSQDANTVRMEADALDVAPRCFLLSFDAFNAVTAILLTRYAPEVAH